MPETVKCRRPEYERPVRPAHTYNEKQGPVVNTPHHHQHFRLESKTSGENSSEGFSGQPQMGSHNIPAKVDLTDPLILVINAAP